MLFFGFRPEIPILGKFGPQNQNCQFKVKFHTETNSNMYNSMGCTLFPFSTVNTIFGQICSKKIIKRKIASFSRILVEYGEFNGGVHI